MNKDIMTPTKDTPSVSLKRKTGSWRKGLGSREAKSLGDVDVAAGRPKQAKHTACTSPMSSENKEVGKAEGKGVEGRAPPQPLPWG